MDIIEELAEKILEYQADVDWYGLCDDYGNIETDEDVRKQVLEEILTTLQNSPEDILNTLRGNLEEIECGENYENDDIYKRTKELIKEIERV